jgi:hypothetical protein
MSFSFNSTELVVKDKLGKIKFSLDKKMAPILYNVTGTIQIPAVLAADPTASFVARTDEFPIVSDDLINTNDYFIMPFYAINGGISDNSGFVTSGQGSVQVREITQPSTGEYLGCSIMTTIVENGVLKIICKHNLDRGQYINIAGDVIINVAYRIYYGRFN